MSSMSAARSNTVPSGLPPAELFVRSDARGLRQLGLHCGLLLLTFWLVFVTDDSLWRLVAVMAHSVVLVALFAPLHECIHRTAFNSRWINDTVALACGFLLLLPREYFRAFHLTHHQNTQDPARDPELLSRKPVTTNEYLRHLSGWPYWRERIATLARHGGGSVTESFIDENRRADIVREARLHLALYAAVGAGSVLFGTTAALTYWILPALLGQPVLRAFLLAEHTGCPLVSDMLKNSRTTRTNFLVKLLAWNMPYHAEHHAFAAIPFHALPRANEILGASVRYRSTGYLSMHRELWRTFLANRVRSGAN